jgi:hypothetical protein
VVHAEESLLCQILGGLYAACQIYDMLEYYGIIFFIASACS